MKLLKIALLLFTAIITSATLLGCENTQVSGSVSYGMGVGYGYPMYYGSGRHYNRSTVVVVKPSRKERSRPSRPATRPSGGRRR
jgi:hypothetical protein